MYHRRKAIQTLHSTLQQTTMYTEECQCKYFNIKVNTLGVNPSVWGEGGILHPQGGNLC